MPHTALRTHEYQPLVLKYPPEIDVEISQYLHATDDLYAARIKASKEEGDKYSQMIYSELANPSAEDVPRTGTCGDIPWKVRALYYELWSYHTMLEKNNLTNEVDAYHAQKTPETMFQLLEERRRVLTVFWEEFMSMDHNLLYTLNMWRENQFAESRHFLQPDNFRQKIQQYFASDGSDDGKNLILSLDQLKQESDHLMKIFEESEGQMSLFNLIVSLSKYWVVYEFLMLKKKEINLLDNLDRGRITSARVLVAINMRREWVNKLHASIRLAIGNFSRTRSTGVIVYDECTEKFCHMRHKESQIVLHEIEELSIFTHIQTLRSAEDRNKMYLAVNDFTKNPRMRTYIMGMFSKSPNLGRLRLLERKANEFRIYRLPEVESLSSSSTYFRVFEDALKDRLELAVSLQTDLLEHFDHHIFLLNMDRLAKLHPQGQCPSIKCIGDPNFDSLPMVGKLLHPEIEKYIQIFFPVGVHLPLELVGTEPHECQEVVNLRTARAEEIRFIDKVNKLINRVHEKKSISKLVLTYQELLSQVDSRNEIDELLEDPSMYTLTGLIDVKVNFLEHLSGSLKNLLKD